MAENNKINWLLILQAWAMLWVVIGHSFLGKPGEGPVWENVLFNFAYSFHMPLFMLVSGWLFFFTRLAVGDPEGGGRFWPYLAILKDKATRLLLPGLIFSLVALALKVAFPGEISRQVGLSFPDIAHSYLYPNDNPMRELWFIVTLFWFFVLTPLWRWTLKQEWKMWITLVFLIPLHFWHPETDFLCIRRVFNFAVYFYLGLVICKANLVAKVLSKYVWITLFVGMLLYELGKYSISLVTTIGGITISFALALITDRFIPKLFSGFRYYTYQIFLMGIFAQMFVKILYKHLAMPYVLAYLICFLAGLYVPVLVSKVIEKINWRFLSLCVGLKTK